MDYLLDARRDIASRLFMPGLSTERYLRENLRRKGNPVSRASDTADVLIGRVYIGPQTAVDKKQSNGSAKNTKPLPMNSTAGVSQFQSVGRRLAATASRTGKPRRP
jgi:hypothetical protein